MKTYQEPKGYSALVRKYEAEGMTTSDAQGCADAYFMSHTEWSPDCKQCGDTGSYIHADSENGPEFDSECPCDCAAGERWIDEQNRIEYNDGSKADPCNGYYPSEWDRERS